MISLPWLFLIGVAFAAVGAWGGFELGGDLNEAKWVAKELTRAQKTVVRIQQERVVEVKVEKEYITSIHNIHTNTETIRNEIPTLVAADCTLPDDFMRQLHALSRGSTVAALSLAPDSGKGASCRTVADHLTRSYSNHRADAEQLNTLIRREEELEKIGNNFPSNN